MTDHVRPKGVPREPADELRAIAAQAEAAQALSERLRAHGGPTSIAAETARVERQLALLTQAVALGLDAILEQGEPVEMMRLEQDVEPDDEQDDEVEWPDREELEELAAAGDRELGIAAMILLAQAAERAFPPKAAPEEAPAQVCSSCHRALALGPISGLCSSCAFEAREEERANDR